MEENSVGLLLNILTLGAVTYCVTCPNLSNPYSEIPGCWKRLFFRPLKIACRLPQGFVPFCLLSALRHIDTGAHLYSS